MQKFIDRSFVPSHSPARPVEECARAHEIQAGMELAAGDGTDASPFR